MDAKHIINTLIQHYGGTQRTFSERIGVSQPTVASWLSQNKLPRSGKMRILQALPEVSMAFLDGTQDTLHTAEPTRDIYADMPQGAPFYLNLPATAGQNFAGDYDGTTERVCIPGFEADAYLPVKGMSMHPTLQNGDIIGVKTMNSLDRLRPNEVYLIMTTDNERMIKRVKEIDRGEQLTLYSDNPDYHPFQVLKEQICGLYRVVSLIRPLA